MLVMFGLPAKNNSFTKKDLLFKSGIISITGSPIPYLISIMLYKSFEDINIEDFSIMLTIIYSAINIVRIFLIEYMFAAYGIKIEKMDNILNVFKRLKRFIKRE